MKSMMFGAALALLAAPAFAQGQPAQGSMGGMGGMRGMRAGGAVMGMHTMPATVTAIDPKTGVVDVTSEGYALKMHYPPASIADLKTGDKITLHLGFSKP